MLRNRQLTTLIRDLPESTVGATPADLVPRPWNREAIHQLFDTLQFRVLRDRLYQTFPDGLPGTTPATAGAAVDPSDLAGFEVEASVLGPDEVAGWIEEHQSSERTGLAVAGSWGRGTGNVTGIALAAPDGAGAYLDPEALTPDDDRALAEWLASATAPEGAARRQGTDPRAGGARVRSG